VRQSQVEDIIFHIFLLGAILAPSGWKQYVISFYAFLSFCKMVYEINKEKEEVLLEKDEPMCKKCGAKLATHSKGSGYSGGCECDLGNPPSGD